jgi:protein ImuA
MKREDSIAGLRRQVAVLEHGKKERPVPLTFGVAGIDAAIDGGLAAGRMHEVNGLAAWSLAIVLAGRAGGPVLWCARAGVNRLDHQLYPPGCVALGLQPQNLLMVACRTPMDALWAGEETLRSGAVRMVVMESAGAIDLTAARRLQLAAETGNTLGLMVGMEDKPAFPAAASRWQANLAQANRSQANLVQADPAQIRPAGLRISLQLTRNRAGAAGGQWMVEWNETARHLSVVSSPARRAGIAARA